MRALGWDVQGMDIDDAALEQARRAGLSVRGGTLEQPAGAAAGGGFDALTLNHVLEHLPDPVGALRSARELLRPGGVLWVATPNLRSLAHRMFKRDWLSLDPPRHLAATSRRSRCSARSSAAGLERIAQPRPVPQPPLGRRAERRARRGRRPARPPGGPVAAAAEGAARPEVALRRPELTEELVVMGRRPLDA